MDRLLTVLLKVASLTYGPAAVADLLLLATLYLAEFCWWPFIVGFSYSLLLCDLPLVFLFGTNLYETALVIGMTFIPRLEVGLAVYLYFARLLG